MRIDRTLALLAALAIAVPAAARAQEADLFPRRFDGPRGLVPRLQVDPVAIFDFIPRGGKGDADWEWPLVISGLVASAVLATGASAITTSVAVGSNFGPQGGQVFWGAMQFLALPPLVALATWGIQAFSSDFDSNYYMPLLFSYAGELILILARIAAVFLVPPAAGGAADTFGRTATDTLGNLKYVDWVLHFLLIPVIAEFITLHQRDSKGGPSLVKLDPAPPTPAWTALARDPNAPQHGLPGADVQTISFAF
jgi:hypothetical protein